MKFRLALTLKSFVWALFLCTGAAAQGDGPERSLKGKVTDSESKAPLVGVYVKVKSKSAAALTNKGGEYSIAVADTDTLLVSHIGYQTREIPVGRNKTLDVLLTVADVVLDDVVVVGYGTVRKKDLTGSVGEVKINDLTKAPVASFDQALAGRIAGVQVSSGEDQPGSEMSIVIRGGNSLTQSNAPLYVIDGFPIEDFTNASLNPSDIASMTILKDASATAIYGSRGANGVIIIETKRGKEGKPVVNYESSYGFQQVTKRMELMNPYEFVKYQLERDPANMTPLYLDDAGKTLEDYKNINGIDWQDLLFRNAPMQSHSLSLRGGSRETKYAISGSYFDQEGVVLNSGYQRYQGRMSIDQTINQRFKAGMTVNYSADKNHGQLSSVAQSTSNSYSTYLLYQVWGYRPVITGNENFDIYDDLFDPEANDNRINPIISLENEVREQKKTNIMANGYLTFSILKDLELKVRGGINNRTIRDVEFYNSKTRRGYPSPNNLKGVNGGIYTRELSDWMNENTLTYKKRFNKNHHLDALAGFTMQGTRTHQNGYEVQQIPNEDLGVSGMDEGIPGTVTSYNSRNALVSYLARVNYNLNERYLLTASIRADGSSKFSPENRWGYFPSAAFAWRMDREKFMSGLSFISESKLRFSYGVTGNNRVGDYVRYPSLDLPISSYYSFNNQTPAPGIKPTNLGNPDLKWEKTTQFDIGYDLSVWNRRLSLLVDVYRKTTSDLLLNANVPSSSGYTRIYKNVGKIRNEGLEITLSSVNVDARSFRWTSDFNISFNRNKIVELSEGEENIRSSIVWTGVYNSTPLFMAEVGGPAASFYGYIWDGIYQYEDFDQYANDVYQLKATIPTNGTPRANIKPGDIKYRDINGDGVVNDMDLTVIGRTLPVHTGGLNNNFTYKNFSLNVFFQWAYGNDIMNANRIVYEGNPYGRSNLNQYATYSNRWTPESQSNQYYRVGGQGPTGVYSSQTLEDGSFLRLKTVSLAYQLPQSLLKRMKIQSIEAFVSAQNLYTWTNYSGMDPEVSVRNTTLTPGFDYSAYPRSRTVTFGLRASL